jgi:ubiquinone/menaquinone biosynthesis C-methylase UbiE
MVNRYKDAVKKHGTCCALDDMVVRQKETDLILNFFDTHIKKERFSVIGDIGCGDGYTLEKLSDRHPLCNYFGIDIVKELLDAANKRKIKNCEFIEGDTTRLNFNDDFFDIVYTQRCLVNLLAWSKQRKALKEIHRVLKPGGYYLMIECFTDGLDNNNKARMECGLPALKPPSFNKYIYKKLFAETIRNKFWIEYDSFNFLSSHYFIARVLHALVTKGEQVKNTEFVKFFSGLPPVGNYSPIQAFTLTKKG